MKTKTKPREYGKRRAKLPTKFTPKLLEQADSRYWVVKEIRRRLEELLADANADSIQKQIIAKRAVFMSIRLETMESDALEGKAIDTGSYGQLTNTLLGCLRTLGIEKQLSKEVNSLENYLNDKKPVTKKKRR